MIALLCNALFAFGGLVAVAAICSTVRSHGARALALREALRDCADTLDLRFSVLDVTVRTGASVLRPDFTGRKVEDRPKAALLAAA